MYYTKSILITGGAGFIGSNLVHSFVEKYPQYQIINLDALTYAGNLKNLKDLESCSNYAFCKGDIRDKELLQRLFEQYNINTVINMAAESHVDRSITNPFSFAETNIMGTLTLLDISKHYWYNNPANTLFYHISTDEVYGSLPIDNQLFTESTPYDPRSPYSASKASSDHLVMAYHHTYGINTIISNCSNNYGPYQFPEKLIPLVINNIRTGRPLPIYGKGDNIRDWLYVSDHIDAIDCIMHNGVVGQSYNIGGQNEWRNIDLVKKIIEITDNLLGNKPGHSLNLITFVPDRKGHDLRYAIDSTKIKSDLGWSPKTPFDVGLRKTIKWYLDNQEWLNDVTSGNYQNYYSTMYNSL